LAEEAAGDNGRYWAFISYSHRDAAFGRRLHRKLETYALPRRLVGRKTAQGTVPKKLAPIFRDREELAAANDLSTEVRAALKASRCLIVVCSPASAASHWVGREIEVFRELHPDRPVLAAMRDGEPADCFPPGLLGKDATGAAIEPLAADFRRGRDGEHLGLLKLVAGILGLGLDELVQRDASRRNQRVTAVTAAALAGMISMGFLTAFAVSAQQEAERQRGEGEDLIGFMSKNLREKLKGVGRLDIMRAVNLRALEYYDKQASSLTPERRGRRALVMLNLADDDVTQGDYGSAQRRIHEAFAVTRGLMEAAPHNPALVFDHAQSEYYVGDLAYAQGHVAEAKAAFLAYKRLADRLVTLAPGNPSYRLEVGYADSNLCTIALDKPVDGPAALRYCADALAQTAYAANRMAPSDEITEDLIDRHAWLADAHSANGDIASAKRERLIEERLLAPQIAADPKNMELKESWVALQIALALVDEANHKPGDAVKKLKLANDVIVSMTALEPANSDWQSQKTWIDNELLKLRQPPI